MSYTCYLKNGDGMETRAMGSGMRKINYDMKTCSMACQAGNLCPRELDLRKYVHENRRSTEANKSHTIIGVVVDVVVGVVSGVMGMVMVVVVFFLGMAGRVSGRGEGSGSAQGIFPSTTPAGQNEKLLKLLATLSRCLKTRKDHTDDAKAHNFPCQGVRRGCPRPENRNLQSPTP